MPTTSVIDNHAYGRDRNKFLSFSVNITLNLCLPCLLVLISGHLIYPMRISHISNQHQSLGKLSQVIRSNYWTPLTSSSTYSPLNVVNISSPFDSQRDSDDALSSTKNTPDSYSPPSSSHGESISTSPSNGNINHRHHSHHHRHSSSPSSSQRIQPQGAFYESPPLKRFMLRNKSVTCNDGTKAGYYFRPSIDFSRRWIVFLEGGWYCFSPATCHQRWLGMRNLMTSAHWPQSRSAGGILSPNPHENPYFWNANHVFVPYCSSDSWSGDSPAATSADLSFLGSRIVVEVINELIASKGLSDGRSLLLAGSSAGAAGVLVNLDRVADLISSSGSKIEVRGLMDSGWFLDNQPFDFHSSIESQPHGNNKNINPNYDDLSDIENLDEDKDDETSSEDGKLRARKRKSFSPQASSSSPSPSSSSSTCTSAINCSPIESIRMGMKLWNGQVPEKCRSRFSTEPWRCYFGYRLYPTLKTPLFVFQWVFDEAQMLADNVGAPISRAQWHYIHQMGQELRNTLANVTAYFAPSCISHIVLTKSNWNSIKINGTSLPQAIRCWELHSPASGRTNLRREVVTSRAHRNQFSSRSQISSYMANGNRIILPINPQSSSLLSSSAPLLPSTINRQYAQTSSLNVKRSSSSPKPTILPQPVSHNQLSSQSLTYLSDKSNPFNRTYSVEINGNSFSNDSLISNRSHKKKAKRRHRKHKKRQQQQEEMIRSKRLAARQELHRLGYQRPQCLAKNSQCRFNHMDYCSWPQCNSGCPKLHNPFTGEEVNFLELLKSYGFNLMAVAQALGLETKALNEMEDGALFQLFHRKVS